MNIGDENWDLNWHKQATKCVLSTLWDVMYDLMSSGTVSTMQSSLSVSQPLSSVCLTAGHKSVHLMSSGPLSTMQSSLSVPHSYFPLSVWLLATSQCIWCPLAQYLQCSPVSQYLTATFLCLSDSWPQVSAFWRPCNRMSPYRMPSLSSVFKQMLSSSVFRSSYWLFLIKSFQLQLIKIKFPCRRSHNITFRQVAEDEIGGPCSTNWGEEERL
jgi:hypothetical protein